MSRRRLLRPGMAAMNGLATLATLLLLLMASLLAAAWAQRSALNEIRSATNQLHSVSAFEAAEAGLAWAQAMLNSNPLVDSNCQPSAAGDASTFRSRFLRPADGDGRFAPRASGVPGLVLKTACARESTGWTCSCPADTQPTLPAGQTESEPVFLVEFSSGTKAGSLDLVSLGCSQKARPCIAAATRLADASARLKLSLVFLPTLTTAPSATLTSRGGIEAGSAALGLHNADAASGGLAAHAGGAINGSTLRISTAPGASPVTALRKGDAALAALTPGRLFSRLFGTDLNQWKHQPGVARLECAGGCTEQLLSLIANNADVARIAIEGDLRIDGNQRVGSRARPVVLVVDGDLLLSGPVQIFGLIYARNMRWDALAANAGGLLHGAAVLSAGFAGDGAPDLVYDPTLMLRLKRHSGTWIRIPGSWRDF